MLELQTLDMVLFSAYAPMTQSTSTTGNSADFGTLTIFSIQRTPMSRITSTTACATMYAANMP